MGRLWPPFDPQAALTGCNSDRDAGLTEGPDPRADDGRITGRRGSGRQGRKAVPNGHPNRKANPAGGRRRVSLPKGIRKDAGRDRSPFGDGFGRPEGRGGPNREEGAIFPNGGRPAQTEHTNAPSGQAPWPADGESRWTAGRLRREGSDAGTPGTTGCRPGSHREADRPENPPRGASRVCRKACELPVKIRRFNTGGGRP